MPRKPIQVELRGLQAPRERVWRAILASPSTFTRMSVQDLCEPMVQICLVADYLEALARGGYLVRVGGGDRKERSCTLSEYEYQLVIRQWDAPRLTKLGKPVTQGLSVTAMWRAMKVLKSFDFHELARAASLDEFVVPASAAKKYVQALGQAGFLQRLEASKPGKAARWRLARNTGPSAPAVTRSKAVFDRNTGVTHLLQTTR